MQLFGLSANPANRPPRPCSHRLSVPCTLGSSFAAVRRPHQPLTKSPIGVPVYRYWVVRFALKSKLTQPAFTGENLAIRFDIWLRRRQVTSPKASMLEEDVAATRAVRSAIGADVALMVDANHAYDAVDAIRLGRKIEGHDIGWFEEPVRPKTWWDIEP